MIPLYGHLWVEQVNYNNNNCYGMYHPPQIHRNRTVLDKIFNYRVIKTAIIITRPPQAIIPRLDSQIVNGIGRRVYSYP